MAVSSQVLIERIAKRAYDAALHPRGWHGRWVFDGGRHRLEVMHGRESLGLANEGEDRTHTMINAAGVVGAAGRTISTQDLGRLVDNAPRPGAGRGAAPTPDFGRALSQMIHLGATRAARFDGEPSDHRELTREQENRIERLATKHGRVFVHPAMSVPAHGPRGTREVIGYPGHSYHIAPNGLVVHEQPSFSVNWNADA